MRAMFCFIEGQAGQPQEGQAKEKGGDQADGPCSAGRSPNKETDVGADGGGEQTQHRKHPTDKRKHRHGQKNYSRRVCSDEGVVAPPLCTT